MSDFPLESLKNGEQISNFYKIIVIGDGFVGKTGITVRFCEDQFKEEYKMTIGVNFGSKKIQFEGKKYAIQLWDIAGQQRFKIFRTSYYTGATCAILVYDVTNRLTFLDLENWICEYQKIIGPKPGIIVGNKLDLPYSGKIDPRTNEKYRKEVSYNELQEFAFRFNANFMETSAKTNHNIMELFETAIPMINDDIKMKYYEIESFQSVESGFHNLKSILDEHNKGKIYDALIKLKQSIFEENPYSIVLGNLSEWIEYIAKSNYNEKIKLNLNQSISAWKYYYPQSLDEGIPVSSNVNT
ncbi:MAG: GTP-binding protein [Candidatus Lokiarchaeota archaeon]|nr:GTP-binding protein [Candidatus Lokiarchaeota archaeon]